MTTLEKRAPAPQRAEISTGVQFALIGFGLIAPFATYGIAVSPFSQDVRVVMLTGLGCVYLAICVWTALQIRRMRSLYGEGWMGPVSEESELEYKLAALDDAREFFGTSLKPADMFRLVSNRVNEIVPFDACLLITRHGENGELLCVSNAFGDNAARFENLEIYADTSLAGLAFLSNEIEVVSEMEKEFEIFPEQLVSSYAATATVPVSHEGDVFAVYQLFFREAPGSEDLQDRLRAIGDRVAPLFLGALAFERSLSKALTDPITSLPNERAFHMVLENQLAESHRFRDERPLTVMAVDIKEFDEINQAHGHVAGDRALSFAAECITSQLRKMDFLARSMNDEFLIVLPKASERTALEITARIRAKFAATPFSFVEGEPTKLWLNFGTATFWHDGETVSELVRHATMQKQQAKTEEQMATVVKFPKEYVN
jgi:diguanylate cyclase (GGDEF)-like protein